MLSIESTMSQPGQKTALVLLSVDWNFLKHTFLWPQSNQWCHSRCFPSSVKEKKNPTVTSLIGVWLGNTTCLTVFMILCRVVCSLAVHRVQLLYTVSWVYCGTQLSFSQRQNSQTIVVALNIRWNLIHLKSQGNQSLLGAEWLSSLQPLTGRDVTSQERS